MDRIIKTEDFIIRFNDTGFCEIDIEKVVKKFDKKCSISKWKNEYRLRRDIYKYICCFKLAISENNALSLIKKLNLYEIKSGTFRNGSMFRLENIMR